MIRTRGGNHPRVRRLRKVSFPSAENGQGSGGVIWPAPAPAAKSFLSDPSGGTQQQLSGSTTARVSVPKADQNLEIRQHRIDHADAQSLPDSHSAELIPPEIHVEESRLRLQLAARTVVLPRVFVAAAYESSAQ